MSDEQNEQERRAGAIEELRRRVIARPGASKIPAEIDALKFGDSSLTPAQREIISRIPVALSPMNMHQKMSEAEAEIGRLTAERDAARAEVERLRDILRRLLDAFGTPATRETETNLSEAMTAYEAANMKDEAHVLRTSIEAIRAALGIEVDHD